MIEDMTLQNTINILQILGAGLMLWWAWLGWHGAKA